LGAGFNFKDQRRALSENVQSTTCCGLASKNGFSVGTFGAKEKITDRVGTVRSFKLLAIQSIEPLGPGRSSQASRIFINPALISR
jgi:hypothetical protein